MESPALRGRFWPSACWVFSEGAGECHQIFGQACQPVGRRGYILEEPFFAGLKLADWFSNGGMGRNCNGSDLDVC